MNLLMALGFLGSVTVVGATEAWLRDRRRKPTVTWYYQLDVYARGQRFQPILAGVHFSPSTDEFCIVLSNYGVIDCG